MRDTFSSHFEPRKVDRVGRRGQKQPKLGIFEGTKIARQTRSMTEASRSFAPRYLDRTMLLALVTDVVSSFVIIFAIIIFPIIALRARAQLGTRSSHTRGEWWDFDFTSVFAWCQFLATYKLLATFLHFCQIPGQAHAATLTIAQAFDLAYEMWRNERPPTRNRPILSNPIPCAATKFPKEMR